MSKRFFVSSILFSVAAIGLVVLTATPASAVKEFKDAFEAKYVKPDSTATNDAALTESFNKAGCAVCHVIGKNKKDKSVRNIYGKQLEKLLTKNDKDDKAKIDKALNTVDKLKSNPSDTSSPTFGEKISSGKLPAAS
jgi:hypothetical protein